LVYAAGVCLGLSGVDAVLQTCDSSAGQGWRYLATVTAVGEGKGQSTFVNPASGRCLSAQALTVGQQVVLAKCTTAENENWVLGPTLIQNGTGECLTTIGPAAVQRCLDAPAWFGRGGQIRSHGLCLGIGSFLDGAKAGLGSCVDTHGIVVWLPGPDGELINEFSGRCLASETSRFVVQEDCYGEPNEIWALN